MKPRKLNIPDGTIKLVAKDVDTILNKMSEEDKALLLSKSDEEIGMWLYDILKRYEP